LAPSNALYRLRQGLSYHNLGADDQALADYNAAIRLDPKLGDAYFGRAAIEDARGDYTAAVADDTLGIRWEPTWWQGYMNRGESYLSLNNWQATIADLTVYIRHMPRGACGCAHYERGNAYFKLYEFAKAYADHKQAIAIGPVYGVYYERLGADAYFIGKYEEAISVLTIALNDDPSDAFAYYYRGMARKASGDRPGALADLQESVQLATAQGDTDNAQVANTELRQLQSETSAARATPSVTPVSSASAVVTASLSGTATAGLSPTATLEASPSPSSTPVAG
jgi:tetratricopeptide (TPR) repeat protein